MTAGNVRLYTHDIDIHAADIIPVYCLLSWCDGAAATGRMLSGEPHAGVGHLASFDARPAPGGRGGCAALRSSQLSAGHGSDRRRTVRLRAGSRRTDASLWLGRRRPRGNDRTVPHQRVHHRRRSRPPTANSLWKIMF